MPHVRNRVKRSLESPCEKQCGVTSMLSRFPVTQTRRMYRAATLQPMRTSACPFSDLPTEGHVRWGGGVTAEEMRVTGMARRCVIRIGASAGFAVRLCCARTVESWNRERRIALSRRYVRTPVNWREFSSPVGVAGDSRSRLVSLCLPAHRNSPCLSAASDFERVKTSPGTACQPTVLVTPILRRFLKPIPR